MSDSTVAPKRALPVPRVPGDVASGKKSARLAAILVLGERRFMHRGVGD